MPNILIVDDSRTMRQFLSLAMKRIPGSKVIEAIDGTDALGKLSSEKVDVILADVNMPVMNGFELVDNIRVNSTYKNIPIIMITTEGKEPEKQRALAIGANAYLTKPIQIHELIKLVKSFIS